MYEVYPRFAYPYQRVMGSSGQSHWATSYSPVHPGSYLGILLLSSAGRTPYHQHSGDSLLMPDTETAVMSADNSPHTVHSRHVGEIRTCSVSRSQSGHHARTVSHGPSHAISLDTSHVSRITLTILPTTVAPFKKTA